MSNYISDVTKTRWMVSNPARTIRTGMDGKSFRCPFCVGNEADTPPEVYRVGEGEANKPGWKIRVVPNKFNITDIHEVIIHSTDHNKNIEELPLDQIENIFRTYVNRFNSLKENGKVFIFSNQSLISGASLIHSHSQISVVPNEIPTNTLTAQPVVNIVEQIGEFVSYCPDYSEWGFETWITIDQKSKIKDQNFGKIEETNIKDLAKIFLSTILKLKKIHGANSHYSKKPFGYNFYIHPYENWHLRIIPRFMERAGFELSTGIMVNSIEAKSASEEMKKV